MGADVNRIEAPVLMREGLFSVLASNATSAGGSLRKSWIGFAAAWIAFFLILYVMPLPAGMLHSGKSTLAVVVWASIMWVTQAIPTGIAGLSVPPLLLLTGAIHKPAQAFSGFTNDVVFLCLGAFVFAAVLQLAGLDRRLALAALSLFRTTTTNGVVWALTATNMVLAMIVPAAPARAAALLPMINGITQFFGDTPGERNAKKAIVITALVYTPMIGGMCILTAHLPNFIITNLFSKTLNVHINYVQWFVLHVPYLLLLVVTQFWVLYYFRAAKVDIPGGHERIDALHRDQPKMNVVNYAPIAIFVIVATFWALADVLKLHAGIIALIGALFLFTPGLLPFKWGQIQGNTTWGTWLLLAGAISLTAAMADTKLGDYIGNLIGPALAGMPWWLIVLSMMAMTHTVRLGMLSNVAAVALLAPILPPLATHLHLNPVSFTLLIADTDTFAYVFPTQITSAVIAYSTGVFSVKDYAKVGIVSLVLAWFFGIFVIAPWYALLGYPVWGPAAH